MVARLLQLISEMSLRVALTRVRLRLASAYAWVVYEQQPVFIAIRCRVRFVAWATHVLARVSYFVDEWVLTTNHRKIAILYFAFVAISGFTGLILATIIRLELAYPGQFFLTNNAERYLTVISLHGIVMVFFFVIPTLFGAFGNFLLPTQLGIRDVAFPRLNSFMFWVTPAGFVMLLHILMFDKSYSLTYWINYSETKAQLRRRYDEPRAEAIRYHQPAQASVMAWRFQLGGDNVQKTRALILQEAAPALNQGGLDALANASTLLSSVYLEAKGLAAQATTAGQRFFLSPLTSAFGSIKKLAAFYLSPSKLLEYASLVNQFVVLEKLSPVAHEWALAGLQLCLPGLFPSGDIAALADRLALVRAEVLRWNQAPFSETFWKNMPYADEKIYAYSLSARANNAFFWFWIGVGADYFQRSTVAMGLSPFPTDSEILEADPTHTLFFFLRMDANKALDAAIFSLFPGFARLTREYNRLMASPEIIKLFADTAPLDPISARLAASVDNVVADWAYLFPTKAALARHVVLQLMRNLFVLPPYDRTNSAGHSPLVAAFEDLLTIPPFPTMSAEMFDFVISTLVLVGTGRNDGVVDRFSVIGFVTALNSFPSLYVKTNGFLTPDPSLFDGITSSLELAVREGLTLFCKPLVNFWNRYSPYLYLIANLTFTGFGNILVPPLVQNIRRLFFPWTFFVENLLAAFPDLYVASWGFQGFNGAALNKVYFDLEPILSKGAAFLKSAACFFADWWVVGPGYAPLSPEKIDQLVQAAARHAAEVEPFASEMLLSVLLPGMVVSFGKFSLFPLLTEPVTGKLFLFFLLPGGATDFSNFFASSMLQDCAQFLSTAAFIDPAFYFFAHPLPTSAKGVFFFEAAKGCFTESLAFISAAQASFFSNPAHCLTLLRAVALEAIATSPTCLSDGAVLLRLLCALQGPRTLPLLTLNWTPSRKTRNAFTGLPQAVASSHQTLTASVENFAFADRASTDANTLFYSTLKPSLPAYTYNGDLFSAAWELRQLWLVDLVSPLTNPTVDALLPLASTAGLPSEEDLLKYGPTFEYVDEVEVLRYLPLAKAFAQVARICAEDTHLVLSALFGSLEANLNTFALTNVKVAFKNFLRALDLPSLVLKPTEHYLVTSFFFNSTKFPSLNFFDVVALLTADLETSLRPELVRAYQNFFPVLATPEVRAACVAVVRGRCEPEQTFELTRALFNFALTRPTFAQLCFWGGFTQPYANTLLSFEEALRLVITYKSLSPVQTFDKVWAPEGHLITLLNTNLWATDTLFGVSWPSTALPRQTTPAQTTFVLPPLTSSLLGQPRFNVPSLDSVAHATLSAALPNNRLFGNASYRHLKAIASGYCLSLWRVDLLNDWRELKLEREVWRSIDTLAGARNHLMFKKKYYSNFYEPGSLVNKVSTWLPNHLLPGWAFVTPYSSRLRYTALGKVDVALVVVFAASLGSIFSSVNYVITYRYIGAPTLKNRRELRSFFVDALLVASRMMILANPALMVGILLLLSDRHFNTSVFDFSGGGDTILFQHLFWFFGHPEVYIIIIPCFGIVNSLLPYYLKKRLSGRLSLQFSMYTIAYMSFAVWGHHMYMVGLANSARTLYSTMTVMISVPASTKVIHWCVTLVESTLTLDVGFLFLLSFMYFFVLGGLSGMFVAHIGFDTIFHDTFYVIGHFHVMFAGAAVCCIFAAFYFYFPAIFGVRYSKFFAYLHYGFYMAGQLLTLIPMFWLGYSGMPRRIMDYPSSFGGWHSIISSGHILTVISFVFFLAMLADSFYEGRAPVSKTKGVSRLNTRLAFYLYESRKLQAYQTKALPLLRQASRQRASRGSLYEFCWKAEMTNFEYVFTASSQKKKTVLLCETLLRQNLLPLSAATLFTAN